MAFAPRNAVMRFHGAAAGGLIVASGRARRPNLALRWIREAERRETREEFAAAVIHAGQLLGDAHLACDARLVARWEDGDVAMPRPAYQRALAALTGRPFDELGFGAANAIGMPSTGVAGLGRLSLDVITADEPVPGPAPLEALSGGDGQAEDPVRRRTFTRLAGAAMLSPFLSDSLPASEAVDRAEALAAALVARPALPGSRALDLAALGRAVARAKQGYQDCRYSEVLAGLPRLLSDLDAACGSLDGDQLLRAHALSADAYHVAASILLKLDHHGLAHLAADRSMRASVASEDPLATGSAARIVTHALMAGGHHRAGAQAASTHAEALGTVVRDHTPDSLSVYGSLLLRGALAAGMAEDRATATELLDEARDAGSRLGADFNHRWTAFGPANVLAHQVNIAVSLGDAGAAIGHARKLDIDVLPITERKASFLIDVARAFAQWGKHDKACQALLAAEQLAPQEVRERPAVRQLIADLLATAPPTIRPHLRDLAARTGADQ